MARSSATQFITLVAVKSCEGISSQVPASFSAQFSAMKSATRRITSQCRSFNAPPASTKRCMQSARKPKPSISCIW